MPFLDILIFAVIAIILALRLKSVLGQRGGYEESPEEKQQREGPKEEVAEIEAKPKPASRDGKGIKALKSADKEFDEKDFMKGAAAAFPMILTAYAKGDLAQLKRLLSYDLLQSFTQSIQQRNADGESLDITLDDLKDVKIVGTEVKNDTAFVTVEFQSTQTRTLTDSSGKQVEDEDTGKLELVDMWTFERDLTLNDPNWKLTETESPDE